MTPSSDGETSLLLWFMAAVVALLAAYLFVGWLRRAHGRQGWREVLGPVVLSATVMGLGMSAAMVLAMSAGGLTFPLGYRWVAIPALVFGPVIACLPAAWWLSRRQNWLALIGCGLLLAAVALAVQTGWIMAAGLRPGITWRFELLGAAAVLETAGFVAAFWLAFYDTSGNGAPKSLWRVGAAALMALTLIAGQEVVGSSVALLAQVGSIYQSEAQATWLCLLAGAILPTILAVLALDLALRNRGGHGRNSRNGRNGGVALNLSKGRKRRRKYRAL